jgi:hypothetical protein
MPSGGHGRGGPPAFDQGTRALHGTKTRGHHRVKGGLGAPMISVAPPPHLTASQRRIWAYYAPQLVSERRLPLKARDALAKYVIALDMVAKLNRKIRSVQAGRKNPDRHPLLGELRQWLAITRLYENDLLLNPASAVRAPVTPVSPDAGEDEELDDILN